MTLRLNFSKLFHFLLFGWSHQQLALSIRIIPGAFGRPYVVPRTKLRSHVCKANTLSVYITMAPLLTSFKPILRIFLVCYAHWYQNILLLLGWYRYFLKGCLFIIILYILISLHLVKKKTC